MSSISSIIRIIISFLIIFIPIRFILFAIDLKFDLFRPLQILVKKKRMQILIDIIIFFMSILLILFINKYINFNDYQLGMILGGYYGSMFTIFGLKK